MDSGTALARAGSTAMKRAELSRPMRLALEAGVVRADDDVFDYGCGRGDDVMFLTALGHQASGWDPHHRPDAARRSAAVVNLGYVLNVIEDPDERTSTLRRAWRLATRALVVAVRTSQETRFVSNGVAHEDGVLTGGDTFQKFFGQAEARAYIDDALVVQSIPLSLGVFVAFKDDQAEQEWLDNRAALRRRVRRLRRAPAPRQSRRDRAYATHRAVLEPLEEFIAEHGRLPANGERPWTEAVVEAFGSAAKAFQVIRHVADEPWWDQAAADRRDELCIRLALARLRKRPRFSELPPSMQRDVRALFGSYTAACEQADDLLFSIGDRTVVQRAVGDSPVGKRTADALYMHVDAVDVLSAPLRVFIGAAEALAGDIHSATIAKIHLDRPRVSYLVYPDFDTDPHPALAESWVVDFAELDVRVHDYRSRSNPPVLHRKHLFVTTDYPRYTTFARLSQQEERHGLLDEPVTIGTRDGWQRRLEQTGWSLRSHRLVRRRA